MSSLISAMFKRKPADEPLSNLRTVSRWLRGLPEGDHYATQEQVVKSLIHFNHAGLPVSKERLQILMHLDENARHAQLFLCEQYLRNPRMSKTIESRLWTTIHAFFWETTRAYHTYLMDFLTSPGSSKFQALVPLLTARAIHGFSEIFRWRAIRHEKPSPKLWLKLHNLYLMSEFDQFNDVELRLYPGDTARTTCYREYMQALLLSTIGTDSLSATQINMICTWLESWAITFTLEQDYSPDLHMYMVDMKRESGLVRIATDADGINQAKSRRYVATIMALVKLRDVESALRRGSNPASLGLGEEFRMPGDLPLLGVLSREWGKKGGERRNELRHECIPEEWLVLHGIDDITTVMKNNKRHIGAERTTPLRQDEILDIQLYGFIRDSKRVAGTIYTDAHAKRYRWTAIDTSERGVGMISTSGECQWALLGHIVGIQRRPGEPVMVGTIRRTSCPGGGRTEVGIQLLSRDIKLGWLSNHQDHIDAITLEGGDPDCRRSGMNRSVIIISEVNHTYTIAMNPSNYAHEAKFTLSVEGEPNRSVRMVRAVDKGPGWLTVECPYTT
jgi:hypothetical protein